MQRNFEPMRKQVEAWQPIHTKLASTSRLRKNGLRGLDSLQSQ